MPSNQASNQVLRAIGPWFSGKLLKNGKKSSLGLLAGTVMNFPVKALPFNTNIDIQEERLLLNIIPSLFDPVIDIDLDIKVSNKRHSHLVEQCEMVGGNCHKP